MLHMEDKIGLMWVRANIVLRGRGVSVTSWGW